MAWVPPLLDFLHHVSPALVTVGLGAFLVQRFFVRRANEAALIDTLVEELEALCGDALEYWNIDTVNTPDRVSQAQLLEQKLVGNIRTLAADLDHYRRRYCKSIEFDKLMVEIMDACTGGTFQSTQRRADSARYIVILNAVNRVKSELWKRKL